MTPYHVATIGPKRYLFLNQVKKNAFQWIDNQTVVSGSYATPAEAINAGYKLWESFAPLKCGFRYTLPTRDEVGSNALFWQMAKSYSASNGHYFDEELGHLCYVDFASQEALDLWRFIR